MRFDFLGFYKSICSAVRLLYFFKSSFSLHELLIWMRFQKHHYFVETDFLESSLSLNKIIYFYSGLDKKTSIMFSIPNICISNQNKLIEVPWDYLYWICIYFVYWFSLRGIGGVQFSWRTLKVERVDDVICIYNLF